MRLMLYYNMLINFKIVIFLKYDEKCAIQNVVRTLVGYFTK